MAVTTTDEINDLVWLQPQWQQLITAHQNQRLAHAYLFYSRQDLGVVSCLQHLANYLLCSSSGSDKPCGQCQHCYLCQQGYHPDCYVIEGDSNAMIKIDTVRLIQEQTYQTRQLGAYQIFIIPQADRLNQAASNALLKILEEPPDNTLFLLQTQHLHSLLPTVISRCQLIQCLAPDSATLKDWASRHCAYKDDQDWELLSRLADFSPLVLKELLEGEQLTQRQAWFKAFYQFTLGQATLAQTVESLTEKQLKLQLQYLYSWVQDVIKLQQGASDDQLTNYDLVEQLQTVGKWVDSKALFNFVDLLQQYWQYVQLSYNINSRLALENILLAWRNRIQHNKVKR